MLKLFVTVQENEGNNRKGDMPHTIRLDNYRITQFGRQQPTGDRPAGKRREEEEREGEEEEIVL